MIRRAPVTIALLIIITVVFGLEVATNAFNSDAKMAAFGAIVPDLLVRGEYWRLVTAMFLHASWAHWFANSFSLYQLGTLYEALFGSRRFIATYFISGVCASLASSIVSNQFAVGASGAIFGILGAFIFSLLRSPQYRHQPWTRNLIGQIVFWIAVNVVIGFSVKFIDNAAHLGGLIAGLLLGFVPHRVPPPPPGSMVVNVPPPAT